MKNKEMKFEIGFWHPFGPHAGETAEEIIKRKQKEIKANGWTLWSFQYRTPETLQTWHREINKKKPKNVLVFCSEGIGATDPKSKAKYCKNYKLVNQPDFQPIPTTIKIPHPLGKKTRGSAFVVKDIIYPVDFSSKSVKWLYQNKEWRADRVPTRSEYLIKPGSGESMRKYRATLVLKSPYLAEITV